MAQEYYTLLANAGLQYEARCKANGLPIRLTRIAIGKPPESVKPLLTSGSVKQFHIRAIFQTSNAAAGGQQHGGGDLAADRTITLRIPSDINSTTTARCSCPDHESAPSHNQIGV